MVGIAKHKRVMIIGTLILAVIAALVVYLVLGGYTPWGPSDEGTDIRGTAVLDAGAEAQQQADAGKTDDAARTLDAAIAKASNDTERASLYAQRAGLYERTGDTKKAIEYYTKAAAAADSGESVSSSGANSYRARARALESPDE